MCGLSHFSCNIDVTGNLFSESTKMRRKVVFFFVSSYSFLALWINNTNKQRSIFTSSGVAKRSWSGKPRNLSEEIIEPWNANFANRYSIFLSISSITNIERVQKLSFVPENCDGKDFGFTVITHAAVDKSLGTNSKKSPNFN